MASNQPNSAAGVQETLADQTVEQQQQTNQADQTYDTHQQQTQQQTQQTQQTQQQTQQAQQTLQTLQTEQTEQQTIPSSTAAMIPEAVAINEQPIRKSSRIAIKRNVKVDGTSAGEQINTSSSSSTSEVTPSTSKKLKIGDQEINGKKVHKRKAIENYSGDIAILFDEGDKPKYAVLYYNSTWELAETYAKDNAYTTHFFEVHQQELTVDPEILDTEEAIRDLRERSLHYIYQSSITDKCHFPGCERKFASTTEPAPPQASSNLSQHDNLSSVIMPVHELPCEVGLKAYEINDQVDVALIGNEERLYLVKTETQKNKSAAESKESNADSDDKSKCAAPTFELRRQIWWNPKFLPLSQCAKENRNVVDWDGWNFASTPFCVVPLWLKNKVDLMLTAVEENSSLKEVYRYNYDNFCSCLLRNGSKVNKVAPEVPNEHFLKKDDGNTEELLEDENSKYLNSSGKTAKDLLPKQFTQRSKVPFSGFNNNGPIRNNSGVDYDEYDTELPFKYYKDQATGWKEDPRKMMDDLNEYSAVLISSKRLALEWGISLKLLQFLPTEVTPNSPEPNMTELAGRIDLSSMGARISQTYHDERCSPESCEAAKQLLRVTSTVGKGTVMLQDELADNWKSRKGPYKLKCGDKHIFASNFPLLRAKNPVIYGELAKLPAPLAMNDPCADACTSLLTETDGVNAAQVYIKRPRQYTAAHQENGNCISANCNCGPGTTAWYMLAEKDLWLLEKLMKDKKLTRQQPFKLTEELAQKHNIPVYCINQRPGELIVIAPGTLHYVIAESHTANIAWNVAPFERAAFGAMIRSVHQNRIHRMASVVPVEAMFLQLARMLINQEREPLTLIENLVPLKQQSDLPVSGLQLDALTAGDVFLFLQKWFHTEMAAREFFRYHFLIFEKLDEESEEKLRTANMSESSELCITCKGNLVNGGIFYGRKTESMHCFRCALPHLKGKPTRKSARLYQPYLPALLKRLIEVFFELATGAKVFKTLLEADSDSGDKLTGKVRMVDNPKVSLRGSKWAAEYRAKQEEILKKYCGKRNYFLSYSSLSEPADDEAAMLKEFEVLANEYQKKEAEDNEKTCQYPATEELLAAEQKKKKNDLTDREAEICSLLKGVNISDGLFENIIQVIKSAKSAPEDLTADQKEVSQEEGVVQLSVNPAPANIYLISTVPAVVISNSAQMVWHPPPQLDLAPFNAAGPSGDTSFHTDMCFQGVVASFSPNNATEPSPVQGLTDNNNNNNSNSNITTTETFQTPETPGASSTPATGPSPDNIIAATSSSPVNGGDEPMDEEDEEESAAQFDEVLASAEQAASLPVENSPQERDSISQIVQFLRGNESLSSVIGSGGRQIQTPMQADTAVQSVQRESNGGNLASSAHQQQQSNLLNFLGPAGQDPSGHPQVALPSLPTSEMGGSQLTQPPLLTIAPSDYSLLNASEGNASGDLSAEMASLAAALSSNQSSSSRSQDSLHDGHYIPIPYGDLSLSDYSNSNGYVPNFGLQELRNDDSPEGGMRSKSKSGLKDPNCDPMLPNESYHRADVSIYNDFYRQGTSTSTVPLFDDNGDLFSNYLIGQAPNPSGGISTQQTSSNQLQSSSSSSSAGEIPRFFGLPTPNTSLSSANSSLGLLNPPRQAATQILASTENLNSQFPVGNQQSLLRR